MTDYYFQGALTGADIAHAIRKLAPLAPPTLILCTNAEIDETERLLFNYVIKKSQLDDLRAIISG